MFENSCFLYFVQFPIYCGNKTTQFILGCGPMDRGLKAAKTQIGAWTHWLFFFWPLYRMWSLQAREQIWATVATHTTAAATLDPLTHCAGWESNLHPGTTETPDLIAPHWELPYCLFIKVAYLASGLTEVQVLYVSAQKEFSDRQSNWWEVDSLREYGPSQKTRAAWKIHIP